MGFATNVQLIRRQHSQQRYFNFPSAIARAMQFQRGGIVTWVIQAHHRLLLRRREALAASPGKQPSGAQPVALSSRAAALAPTTSFPHHYSASRLPAALRPVGLRFGTAE